MWPMNICRLHQLLDAGAVDQDDPRLDRNLVRGLVQIGDVAHGRFDLALPVRDDQGVGRGGRHVVDS